MLKKLWSKISNTGALIGIVSGLVLVANQWGVTLPNENIMLTVKFICYLGVMLGILDNSGGETTTWNK